MHGDAALIRPRKSGQDPVCGQRRSEHVLDERLESVPEQGYALPSAAPATETTCTAALAGSRDRVRIGLQGLVDAVGCSELEKVRRSTRFEACRGCFTASQAVFPHLREHDARLAGMPRLAASHRGRLCARVHIDLYRMAAKPSCNASPDLQIAPGDIAAVVAGIDVGKCLLDAHVQPGGQARRFPDEKLGLHAVLLQGPRTADQGRPAGRPASQPLQASGGLRSHQGAGRGLGGVAESGAAALRRRTRRLGRRDPLHPATRHLVQTPPRSRQATQGGPR